MEIDIRDVADDPITRIRFARDADQGWHATYLDRQEDSISIEDGSDESVRIMDVRHARNLIKALEKAIELGWLK